LRTTQRLNNKLAGLLVVAIFAALLLPAFAGAQQVSPSQSQYGDRLEQISAGGGGNDPGSAATSSAGDGLGGNVGPLPFTGFDVIAMAAVALAVTGLGLALQRAVSRDTGEEIS
jgi:hypothetical protein